MSKAAGILGLVGLVGLLGFASTAKAAESEPSGREPWDEPIEPPTDEALREALCWAVERTARTWDRTTERSVLEAATQELFGVQLVDHVEGDHPSATQAIDRMRAMFGQLADVAAAGGDPCETVAADAPADAPGPAPTTSAPTPPVSTIPDVQESQHGTEPFGSVEPSPGTFASVDPPATPPKIVLDPVVLDPPTAGVVASYPQGGRLYQVRKRDTLLGEGQNSIVYRWISSDAFLAAKAAGQTDSQARATARSLARNARLRIAAYQLLGCVPWNDTLYGTYQVSRLSFPLFQTGRGFTMLPIHAKNLDRLQRSEAPIRTITLGEPGQQGDFVAKTEFVDQPKAFALFWLPPLDDAELLAGRIKLRQLPYSDGSSRIWPPPAIADLGHLSAADIPQTTWGCQGHEVRA